MLLIPHSLYMVYAKEKTRPSFHTRNLLVCYEKSFLCFEQEDLDAAAVFIVFTCSRRRHAPREKSFSIEVLGICIYEIPGSTLFSFYFKNK